MTSDKWADAVYTVTRRRGGSESYYSTLIPEYAKQYEDMDIQQHHDGKYLIMRPTRQEDDNHIGLNLPERLAQWDESKQRSYLENTLQAYIISGYNRISVDYPEEYSSELAELLDKHISGLVAGLNNLSWQRTDRVLIADSTDEFESYAEIVSSFIFRFFISTLKGVEDEQFRSPENMEKEIDVRWSQVTRISVEQLFELKRNEFARALNNLYVSNYLERLIDEAQKVIERIQAFDSGMNVVDHFTTEVAAICEGKSDLVEASNVPSLDTQVKKIAINSYNLRVKYNGYRKEQELYDARINALSKLKIECLQLIKDESEGNGASDESSKDIAETSILIGEIVSWLDRILKIPRSLALVGFAFKQIGEIHDTTTA